MKIYIGTDHKGVNVLNDISKYLNENSIDVVESKIEHSDTDDYVDFAKDVCENVLKNKNSFGILICGTGIGMSIAANKIKGIRAARCVTNEDAYLTRTDNNSNVLCLSYKINTESLKEIINTFITTPFSSEERHIRRVNKIKELEDEN